MKQLFILILAFFCAGAAMASDEAFYHSVEFQKRAVEFVSYMEQLQTNAERLSQNEKIGSLMEDKDKYNLLSPFYLMQTDTSPLSGTRGYGNFTDLPFGKVRLVSCYSGIQENRTVFAAVHVISHPDWYFFKPDIQVTSKSAQTPIISAPLNVVQPGEKPKDTYYNTMFFPIILELDNQDEPYNLTALIKIKACDKNGCDTFETPLELPLTNTERFPTGICPLLIQVLQQTPLPPVDGTTVQANQNEKGDIQFFFEFAQTPKVLSIHFDGDFLYEEISNNIKGQSASVVIKPITPVEQGEILPLQVITTQQSYDLPVQINRGTFIPLTFPFAWGAAFLGGFILFFFTPFFALFMTFTPRTQKEVKQKGREVFFSIMAVALLFALSYQAKLIIPYPLVQSFPLLALFAALVLIYLLIFPKTSVLGAFLGLLILPKPYLDSVFNTMPSGSLYPFFITLYWGVCLGFVFYLMYKKPAVMLKVFKIFKSTPKQTYKFIRIPLVLLLGWLVIGSLGNAYVNKDIPAYTPELLQKNLNEGKIVFVSVENPVCLQCVWNKAIALKTGFARPLYKDGRLVIMRLDESFEQAREFKFKNDKNTLPINMLYGPSNKNGLLLPDYLAYTELKKYLLAVLKLQ